MHPVVLVYVAHVVFWTAFGVTRLVLSRNPSEFRAESAPTAQKVVTARFSKAMLVFHMVAFALMYGGIGAVVFTPWLRENTPRHPFIGGPIIACATALAVWALLYFRSWRFRAQIDQQHQLATGGPFRLFRHPIYAALNLLAIGSAIWLPTMQLWIAAVLLVIGSDIRGRAEEKVLTEAFGQAYRDYCARTRRFIPGIY